MIWTRSFYSEQRSCQPALKKSETKEEDIEYEASTKRKSLLKKGNVSMTHNCKRKHQCTTMHDTKTADMSCIPTRKKDNEYKSCLKRKKPAEAE
jgi:hypothetical protein